MSTLKELTDYQRKVLGEIVFGKYETSRRDTSTLRALLRHGFINQEVDPPGIVRLPSVYVATAAGRKAMVVQ